MTLKFEKLSDEAIVPFKGTGYSAGYDLTAVSVKLYRIIEVVDIGQNILCIRAVLSYGIGLAIAIPEDYEGEIRARSSICNKDMSLCNGVGTIDSDYRGEILLRFNVVLYLRVTEEMNLSNQNIEEVVNHLLNKKQFMNVYSAGDRIGQLLLKPVYNMEFEEEELDNTERGEGGFGSTNG